MAPKADPSPAMKYTQIFINNEWVDAESGRTFETKERNQKIGKLLSYFHCKLILWFYCVPLVLSLTVLHPTDFILFD